MAILPEAIIPFQKCINLKLIVRIPQQASSVRCFEILTPSLTFVFPNRLSLGVCIACSLVHFQIRSFVSKSTRSYLC
jgi:hypothetical protein